MPVTLRIADSSSVGGSRELAASRRGEATLNVAFTERQEARFVCPAGAECQLFIDDELLLIREIEGVDVWVWTPNFYAGTVRAELLVRGEAIGQTYLLDVAPDSRKVGQNEFRRLVQDIFDVDPTLVLGNEPATHLAGGSATIENADLHYAYLFQYGSELLAALRAVEERPRRSLKSSRLTVPLSRVRRADTHTAVSMARNGSLALLHASNIGNGRVGEARELRFNVPFSIDTLDSAATRCIAAITRAVLRRAVKVSRVLERQAVAETDSALQTSFRQRWPRRRAFLESLVEGLGATFAREPFRSISREEVTAAGLTAVAADPIYARVQRLTWKILRPGTPAADADGWAWMSPTWNLYETWCFIAVARTLRQLLPDVTWRGEGASSLTGTGHDLQVRLLAQQPFKHPRDGVREGDLWSISKEFRPDLVIAVERSSERKFIVLDAKYSQSRSSVLEAMYSAHVYHDALRWHGRPPDRSLLLVPASGGDLQWLREEGFKADHGVGVVICSPTDESYGYIGNELRKLLHGMA